MPAVSLEEFIEMLEELTNESSNPTTESYNLMDTELQSLYYRAKTDNYLELAFDIYKYARELNVNLTAKESK